MTGVVDHRFPCAACGSDLRFDPDRQALVCDHCGNVDPIAESAPGAEPLAELDLAAALEAYLPETDIEETRTRTCQSCGATVEFDPHIHARECPFCASPLVTDTGIDRHIRPGGVLPFALDEDEARHAMAAWLGRLWFAPNGLRSYARKGRRMRGVYVPYWTFDAETRSRYRGQRGTVHTQMKTVVRNGKRQTIPVQRVRWRPVAGRVARFFDDVLVLASGSLPRAHAEGVAPWDLARLEPYSPEYLAGFQAEAYQLQLAHAFVEARAIMDRRIERDVRFDIGGDRQRIHHIDTEVSAVTFKHVLLPIWIAAYGFRGQSYRLVVNGQTGRVAGERPWSAWKLALALAAALILGAALAFLYAQGQAAGGF